MSTNGKTPLRFGILYDFRNPAAWERPYTSVYSEIFEQVVWADQHGFHDGVKAQAVIDAAFKSDRTGCWVDVP